MDLLKLIKDKCDPFSGTDIIHGLKSVISHIEIAELHLEKGKMGDDYFFTDVIYRCNQAFEGSLKEAYKVFAGEDTEKSPYEIEQYFEGNSILKERVLTLFTNYRKEWRNKSTHDYKLYFTDQEAFLALVSICAFFNILLDEMLEKKAYNQEKEDTSTSISISAILIKEQTLLDEITQIILEFSKKAPSLMKGSAVLRYIEKELIGSLSAYVSSVDDNLKTITEYPIPFGDFKMRADIFIQNDRGSLFIEIKSPTNNISQRLRDGREQLISYMTASETNEGIIYIPPIEYDDKMTVNEVKDLDTNKTIVEIYPERFLVNIR